MEMGEMLGGGGVKRRGDGDREGGDDVDGGGVGEKKRERKID